jgi:hypothetical protein
MKIKKSFIYFGMIIALSTLFMNISSMSPNDYILVKVKTIPSGPESGMIGWEEPIAGGRTGPTCFVISRNDSVYIPDRINRRVNVYDTNFEFIESIEEKEIPGIYYTFKFEVSDDGKLLYLATDDDDLVLIGNEGESIFRIKGKNLPRQVKQFRNFFIIEDRIFFYNDDESIGSISSEGVIKNDEAALGDLNRLSREVTERNQMRSISIPTEKRKIFNRIRNEKKYLLVDDSFFNSNFYDSRKYYKKIADIRKYMVENKLSAAKKTEINESDIEDWGSQLIGYDNVHNSYWKGIKSAESDTVRDYYIIVYSRFGELIDVFQYGRSIQYEKKPGVKSLRSDSEHYPASGSIIAVAPTGDVYFLVGNQKEYTFYKVTRRW